MSDLIENLFVLIIRAYRFVGKWWPWILAILVLTLILVGYYPEGFGPDIKRAATLIVLFSFTLIRFFLYLKRSQGSKKDSIEVGILIILSVEVILLYTGGVRSSAYPLMYLTIALLTALLGIRMGLALVFTVILVEDGKAFIDGSFYTDLTALWAHHFFLLVFSIGMGLFLSMERKGRLDLEGTLKNIQDDTEEFDYQMHNIRSGQDLKGLSREGKEKYILSTITSLDNKFSEILRFIHEKTGSLSAVILLLEEDKNSLKLREAISKSKSMRYYQSFPLKGSVFDMPYNQRVPCYLSNVKNSDILPYYGRKEGVRSFFCVPIEGDGNVDGFICIDSLSPDAFEKDHQNIVSMGAKFSREILISTRMIQQVHYKAHSLASFNEVTQKLNSSLNPDEVSKIVIDAIGEIVDFDIAAVVLSDNSKDAIIYEWRGFALKTPDSKKIPLKEGVVGWTISHKQVYSSLNFQAAHDRLPIFKSNIRTKHIQSVVCLPLVNRDICSGAILIGSYKKNHFSPTENLNLRAFSNQAALAVSNTVMYREKELLAVTDGLTGLYNHRYFIEKLSEELARAGRYPQKVSILIMDLDFFKKVNDRYGHQIGDDVLREVAGILRGQIRAVDLLARYGGEEFALILPNTDESGAKKIAERMRSRMEKTFFDSSLLKKTLPAPISLTISIGISVYPSDGEQKDELIKKADSALYAAKEKGRNKVYLFRETEN